MVAATPGALQAAAPEDPALLTPYNYPLYTEGAASQSFNAEVMRGMVVSPDGTKLYAINSYAGSVMEFDLTALPSSPSKDVLEPVNVWPTVKDPVAIAFHANSFYPNGRLFVLGQGTHALSSHDPANGRFISVFTHEGADEYDATGFSEPADLVIDEVRSEAYVSCMGSDAVFRLNIGGQLIQYMEHWATSPDPDERAFQLKRPRFLSWHNDALYVAPFTSGNNTLAFLDPSNASSPPTGIDGTTIANGYDVTQVLNGGLPDTDLLRITPLHNGGHAVPEHVFRRAGSLLTAHGYNAAAGEYWMLGIDSRNLKADTEPNFEHDFAGNTRAHAALPSSGSVHTFNVATEVEDLDLPNGATAYSSASSLPFPYAMEFGGPSNLTAIASSTLSRVALVTTGGTRQATIPPSGTGTDWSVVRDMCFLGGSGSDAKLLLYCQQSSNIVVWPVPGGNPTAAPLVSLSLMSDPTPSDIAEGRAIFYDAERSLNHRSTCATCHPGGESDLLVWSIRDGVNDFKDVMVTQPLKGLRENFPYHWRGERDIHDFNGAFVELLGDSVPLGTPSQPQGGESLERDRFEAFLFSLRPAANPLARLTRELAASVTVPLETGGTASGGWRGGPSFRAGEPYVGQQQYLASTCNTCHILPTGGAGSIQPDNNLTHMAAVTRNVNIETMQLSNFLQARNQPLLKVTTAGSNGATVTRPMLGAGFLHTGGMSSVAQFILSKFQSAFPGANGAEEGAANAAAFILSLDTGTPPAAHHAIVLNRVSTQPVHGDAHRKISELLVYQASRGVIDLVVHGVADFGTGTLEDCSWTFDRTVGTAGLFVPDNGTPPQPLSFFNQFTSGASVAMMNVFIGVPLGTGPRYGNDFDGDGQVNGDEPGGLARWDHDRDNDDRPDGYEVDNGTDPDVNDPANDMAKPNLKAGTYFTTQLVRSTSATFSFTADEDVRWILIAGDTASMVPSVVEYGWGYARRHTAHLHDLRFDTTYNVRIILFDRAGKSTTVPLRDLAGGLTTLTTLPDRGGFTPSQSANEAVVVTDFKVIAPGPSGTNGYTATFELTVGDYSSPQRPPVDGWSVIAQVTRQNPVTKKWTVVSANALSVSGALNLNVAGEPLPLPDLFDGASYPAAPFDPTGTLPTGALLYLPVTGSAGTGKTQVTVEVTDAGSDPIALTVVTVLKESDNVGASAGSAARFPIAVMGGATPFARWVMPETDDEHRMQIVND